MVQRTATATRKRDAESDWRSFGSLQLTPILTVALDVFHQNGFHGATVRDIARQAGLTVPALYYHYKNKEGLLEALLEVGTAEVAWRVRAAAEEAASRPDLQFVNVIEAIVLHMAHHTRLAGLDSELRHLSPGNRKRYAARRKEIENVFASIVKTGAREGVFTPKDPAETARALLGMCQSIVRWYKPRGSLSPVKLAERYIDIALMAVGIAERPGSRPTRRRKR